MEIWDLKCNPYTYTELLLIEMFWMIFYM